MVRKTKSVLLASVLPAAAFFAAVAFADDYGRMTGRGMMGRGMMDDTRGGMMGTGMEGCMQMMQGLHGGARPPNEQWRP
jgi:hypothetical protein